MNTSYENLAPQPNRDTRTGITAQRTFIATAVGLTLAFGCVGATFAWEAYQDSQRLEATHPVSHPTPDQVQDYNTRLAVETEDYEQAIGDTRATFSFLVKFDEVGAAISGLSLLTGYAVDASKRRRTTRQSTKADPPTNPYAQLPQQIATPANNPHQPSNPAHYDTSSLHISGILEPVR